MRFFSSLDFVSWGSEWWKCHEDGGWGERGSSLSWEKSRGHVACRRFPNCLLVWGLTWASCDKAVYYETSNITTDLDTSFANGELLWKRKCLSGCTEDVSFYLTRAATSLSRRILHPGSRDFNCKAVLPRMFRYLMSWIKRMGKEVILT